MELVKLIYIERFWLSIKYRKKVGIIWSHINYIVLNVDSWMMLSKDYLSSLGFELNLVKIVLMR